MKIRIYGGSGSGKTYLSSQLAKELSYPVLHLDDVFYDQDQAPLFSVRRDLDESQGIISEFISQKNWVVDGGWYSLEQQSYDKADILVYLRVPLLTRCFRIFKRYVRRKRQGVDERFFSNMKLLWYTITHNKKFTENRLRLFAQEYGEKMLVFSSADKAFVTITGTFCEDTGVNLVQ